MYKLFGLALVAAALCSAQQPQQKIKIHLFFESLCPDSIRFVVNHLLPNFDGFSPFIDIVLVPFGKSSSLATGGFECQHGPAECKLNRIMSCALALLPTQQQQVHYVGCQMQSSAERSGQRCVEDMGLPWDQVARCYADDMGRQLQLAAEREQKLIIGYPKFVPTIVANEVYNAELQDAFFRDFKGTICNAIHNAADNC